MTLNTYTGNCHCGAFRYQIKHSDITSVSECNCSYCTKQGYAFISPSEFNVLRGELKEYRFASKSIAFQFCETCGTPVVVLLKGRTVVNARTITGLDIWKLDRKWLNGKDSNSTEHHPSPAKHSLVPEEGERIYTGGCHCGDVKIAVRTKPLPEVLVKECNCSICIRKGLIHFYPLVAPDINPQVEVEGEDNLSSYSWGRKFAGHRFCKTCGVQVDTIMFGPPKAVVEKLQGPALERYNGFMKMRPVNIRALDDVEWAGEVGEYLKKDGKVDVTREYDDGKEPYVLGP